jgi:hypothetical protein
MVGFVDDSTGQVNDFQSHAQSTPEALSEFMQHDAKLWNYLLRISGGLLELSKCLYHHIHFDFDTYRNATPRLGPVGPPITIPANQTNADIIILSKSVTNLHKTLDHYKAPAGNAATQLSILKTKCNKFGKQVATGLFYSRDAWIFYQSIYMKSMGYILPRSFFTKAQLKSIQTAAITELAPQMYYLHPQAMRRHENARDINDYID